MDHKCGVLPLIVPDNSAQCGGAHMHEQIAYIRNIAQNQSQSHIYWIFKVVFTYSTRISGPGISHN